MGAGVVGTGEALWVEAEPIDDSPPTRRTESPSSPASTGPRPAVLLEKVGGRGLSGLLRDVETPGALADTIGWWPDLSVERKIELLETIDVEARLELAVGVDQGVAGRDRAGRADPPRRHRRHGEAAA